ncbi:DUF4041 domain-containing protein [Saccharothrix syringae]|uniref:DUF4041 domain-containing protein n=1 Tax=Saccharothrix syringae TaxID=103733 RepID=A0A5Q0GXF8_SACSY|nr:DUF4041 domain-containing protein [Saccharothrix syringae]QFZ18355.1 DUF4041 domain-containing protein [Saccharothrix syringae]
MALFGNRESAEVAALQQQSASAHAAIAELRGWVGQLRGAGTPALGASRQRLAAEVGTWQSQLVETREPAPLHEVGIYEYAHPLDSALAYKGDAVACQVDWAVNGSVEEGQKLGRDIAKLMPRAYDTEADNAVRAVKPHTREAVKKRLRLHEIDLTADHLVKAEAEREAARAEREKLREEAKVMKEIERERARPAKERSHYATVVAKLEAKGDHEGLARAREQLASVEDAITGVEQRAANVRAGYVYVISNVGAFGPDVVKIGMTRRLEPMDRVRELGDASGPFRFDTHALFFYATPAEVRDLLAEWGNDHVLEYTETAEAVEWRASEPGRRHGDGAAPHPRPVPLAATRTDAGADGDLTERRGPRPPRLGWTSSEGVELSSDAFCDAITF